MNDWSTSGSIEQQRDAPKPLDIAPPPPPVDFGTAPPYYLAAPDVPSQPAPQPQIVDRQQYWQSQLQAQQEALQRAEAIRNHFMAINNEGIKAGIVNAGARNFAAGLPTDQPWESTVGPYGQPMYPGGPAFTQPDQQFATSPDRNVLDTFGSFAGEAADVAAYPFSMATKGIEALPVGPLATPGGQWDSPSIGETIDKQPAPARITGHIVTGGLPYVALFPVAEAIGVPAAALNVAFAGAGSVQATRIGKAWKAGQLSNTEAAIQLGITGALFIDPGLRSIRGAFKDLGEANALINARNLLDSAEGKPIVTRLQQSPQGQAILDFVQKSVNDETGAVDLKQVRQRVAEMLQKLRENPSADNPTLDTVSKLTELIKQAKPVNEETAALRSAEMGKRAAGVNEAITETGGRGAIPAALSRLRGQLPRGEFTPPAELGFTGEEADTLFNHIWQTDAFTPREPLSRLNTATALERLIFEGTAPTRSEIALLEKVFGGDLASAILSKRPLSQKLIETALDAANAPRALLSAYDASAVLRQGAVLTLAHPIEAFWGRDSAVASMFKALTSEKNAAFIDQEIRSRPNAPLYEASGLYRSPIGRYGALSGREEAFMSRLIERFPGVRQSERMYVTYLNKLRTDVFDTVVDNWTSAGIITRSPEGNITQGAKQVQSLASFINHATGRGDIPDALKDFTPTFNAMFFSPRTFVSRIQMPLDLFMANGAARGIVARDLGIFVGTNVALLSALKLSGLADVQLNPRSADFGKIRVGNQRIDFWAGYAPIARVIAQTAWGERASLDPLSGKIKNQSASRDDILYRFLQSKASPGAGLALDIARGQTFTGQELTGGATNLRTQAFDRLVPLFVQDMVNGYQQRGLAGLGLASLSGLGASVQSYESMGDKEKALIDSVRGVLTQAEQDALNNGVVPNAIRQMPEWQKLQQEKQQASLDRPDSAEFTQQKMARDTAIKTAGERLSAGEITPDEYRKIDGDARTKFRIQAEGKDFPGKSVLDDYFKQTYDKATDPKTGEVDFLALDQLQADWNRTATQEQRNVVQQNELASDDPTERDYRAAKQTLGDAGYYKKTTEAFGDWVAGLRKADATPENVKALAENWKSPDDLRKYIQDEILPKGNAPDQYYTLQPIWAGWQKWYDRANQRFLATHPEVDLLAVQWGYQDRVHSAEAATLWKQKFGTNPPVPR